MGVTTVGDTTYMLTWKAQTILSYSLSGLLGENAELLEVTEIPLPPPLKQGWGLSHNSRGHLFVSDGTDTIHVIDSASWKLLDSIRVKD